jgi:ABC-type phosphate transport system substrate-binding protein
MKSARTWSLLGFLLFSFVPCFAHHMAVVVNKENGTREISSTQLARLFRLEEKKWDNGRDVLIVLHKDSPGEATTLKHLNGISGNEWKSLITAHKDFFVVVDSDADVLRVVESTPGAIGLVEVHSIDDQVNVVKVDGKLPLEAGYLPH